LKEGANTEFGPIGYFKIACRFQQGYDRGIEDVEYLRKSIANIALEIDHQPDTAIFNNKNALIGA
jgi:DUF971 family protein